jgi:hypothetical protein
MKSTRRMFMKMMCIGTASLSSEAIALSNFLLSVHPISVYNISAKIRKSIGT